MAPKSGLDEQQVVAAATRIADAGGIGTVTVAAVAAELGVRPPSLYNHVRGLDALVIAIGTQALQELAGRMSMAAVGLAGDEALLALARTQRDYAREHPGAYAATTRIVGVTDERFRAAGSAVVDVVFAVLRGYGLEGDDAIHAARAVRSVVHGFVTLEHGGAFGLPVDLDASFDRAVLMLAAGMQGDEST